MGSCNRHKGKTELADIKRKEKDNQPGLTDGYKWFPLPFPSFRPTIFPLLFIGGGSKVKEGNSNPEDENVQHWDLPSFIWRWALKRRKEMKIRWTLLTDGWSGPDHPCERDLNTVRTTHHRSIKSWGSICLCGRYDLTGVSSGPVCKPSTLNGSTVG